MATRSRVVESSFRFGSGRYIQEPGALSRLGEEIVRLHCAHPLILGGKTAFSLTREKLSESLDKAGLSAEFTEYTGFCNREAAADLARYAAENRSDIIVGVGGGNICDLAKLTAANADLPVITVPTSSATCACYTPLSVTYTADFQAAGTVHHKCEVNAVLVDTDVLCRQPERLFAAGVYDALAKLIEIDQRLQGKPEAEIDVGLSSSYALSKYTYDKMTALFDTASADLRAGENSKALSDMIFLAMAVTGVISGLARGSNQCAIAHKIYEGARTLYPLQVKDRLHGEMVAVGLLAQLYYNGEESGVEPFRAQMRAHGLAGSLPELGVPAGKENLTAFYDYVLASTAMAGTGAEERERLWRALAVIG